MNTQSQFISYAQTGAFSKTVTDYVAGNAALQPFYSFPVSIDGVKAAITQRQKFATNRALLVNTLKKQYSSISTTNKVSENIQLLLNENTFTITTAHQPNIFTGPLYFLYKILHAIKLAAFLTEQIEGCNFVPVYYMGSEDADLDELGHIYVNGEKLQWQTAQTGAVGRMKVDAGLIKLIEQLEGQLLINEFGSEIITLFKQCYTEGATIEQATFGLVNELFKNYGLVILLPDNVILKNVFAPVIEKELTTQFSHKAVAETVAAFPHEYKVQAGGRELNLFYLNNDTRERIEFLNKEYKVNNTSIVFDETAIKKELAEHPERFSPNVILRPVFQETILPNIAFIGGGGELAYWLELKKVFEAAGVPYPVLVVRNSFLITEKQDTQKMAKYGFNITDMFKPEAALFNDIVKRETAVQLSLKNEVQAMQELYGKLQQLAAAVDASLIKHTAALQVKAINKLTALEKKMLRAEKKKFEAEQRQLHQLKTALFPHNNLQERIENAAPFYAKWGSGFIDMLYKNTLTLEQQFGIIEVSA